MRDRLADDVIRYKSLPKLTRQEKLQVKIAQQQAEIERLKRERDEGREVARELYRRMGFNPDHRFWRAKTEVVEGRGWLTGGEVAAYWATGN